MQRLCPGADFGHDVFRVALPKRILAANKDLLGAVLAPAATEEQFDLFARYQTSRHGDGSMAKMDIDDYQTMVEDSPIKTLVIEYRLRQPASWWRALCRTGLSDGLSMVYSFYDPEAGTARPRHVHDSRPHPHAPPSALELGHFVYLGYWIAEAPKMAYKTKFRPLETLGRNGWERLDPPAPTS